MEATTVLKRAMQAGTGLARLLVATACFGLGAAQAVTINVTGAKGAALSDFTGFRYTIEEDGTYDVVPDVTGLSGNLATDPTLSLGFHKSHMKVVAVGKTTGTSVAVTLPDTTKRYFVTVMPNNDSFSTVGTGYTINGTAIPANASAVTVPLNKIPFNTAQISVFVFEDNGPINGAADAPGEQEQPLCGFEVQLFEAGGTYGASGGRVATDTFGNPLGTEYGPNGADDIVKPGSNQLFADRNGVVRIKNLSPAKYTIYSIAPHEMPSVKRCNFANADGSDSSIPIWVRNEAARTRADQLVWDSQYELPADPRDGDKTKWHQTTTIEGTWGVDAWVKSGEPTFFKEFGPPGHHVWHGWVRRFKNTAALNGGETVRGKVVNTHMSRPPGITFHSGAPITNCWVGINSVQAGVGLGQALYANACKPDGTFEISGLVSGQRYQLAVWDEALDNVIANYEFVATPALTANAAGLGNVPVFSWFSNLQGKVFYEKGTSNPGFPFDASGNPKPGIPYTTTNIRFRDGSIYNSTVTDDEGNYEFAEVFPFFNWMIAELDFTRFKARGATIIPDNGGAVVNPAGVNGVSNPGLWPEGTMTPQAQPDNAGKPFRIFGFSNPQTGEPTADGTGDPNFSSANLLQAFQGFLGQTNVIHWAMGEYDPKNPKDHGGITGIVHYASTRAENDPMFATAENNEPGIPGVEIRLYKLNSANNVVSPNGSVVSPRNAGRANVVRIVRTDSWNDSQPEGCVDPTPYKNPEDGTGVDLTGKCYDGMRVWNQVRDGVFDGGFGFSDYCPAGVDPADEEACNPDPANGNSTEPQPLPPGRYMTEAVAPPGFEHQKEEDKNVDFGDLLTPATLSNPASCLGDRAEAVDGEGNPVPRNVPAFLELFPDVPIPARFRDTRDSSGNIVARRPYCNKKLVVLAPGMNPFSDFHMFTKAPIAGHIVGMILDDLANEFDPYAPSFGEKYAPPFMPISIRDYAGNEINRVYSDRYGTYNAMVPSTFAYNVPLPSGVAPNMVNVCLNSPVKPDGTIDPHYNPQYTQYCYTFQYLPGKTTYLDTPVLPIAAFAGPSQYALDTEMPDGTPGIKSVTTDTTPGPWVPASGTRTLTITAMGPTLVSNPAYEQTKLGNPAAGAAPKTVERDYGFGSTAGTVRIVRSDGTSTDLTVASGGWTVGTITASVPTSVNSADLGGTIQVVRGDNGRRSTRGVTLHVGTTNMPNGGPIVVAAGGSIQAAIDSASDGDLIIVPAGVYEEAPIIWKRVRVQGAGAPVTIVNASMGADYVRQQAWREKICALVGSVATPGPMSTALITAQTLPADLNACLTGDTTDNAPLLFASEEASGFFVLQRSLRGNAARMANKPSLVSNSNNCAGNNQYNTTPNNNAFNNCPVLALQIDGFTVTGADTGGGIVANGNATQLQISNNRVTGNQGLYNGGIRIGHADLLNADLPVDSNNRLVNIHHNEILKNGNLSGEVTGGGGGVSIYTGSDGYRVADNYIAGNFSTGDGGGMAHFGRSGFYLMGSSGNTINADNRTALGFASTVSNNEFRFNQSFSQSKSVQGGGLAVVGILDPADTGITLGTGSMTILNNTFQGNLAGAGDGGGIALVGVNGTETTALWLTWNQVDILNNVIVNNGAGVAGGGISLQDAAKVNIINNTVALNDSYATAARAFQIALNGTDPNNLNLDQLSQSVAQNGAGIAAYGHSPGLLAQVSPFGTNLGVSARAKRFSDATIKNSVVLGNRRYSWAVNNALPVGSQCSYTNGGAATAGGTTCFGLTQAPSDVLVNDIAVLFSNNAADALAPTYSVFTQTAAGTGNKVGTVADFASAYQNGQNGALKQLLFALEQTVNIGKPVLEVQEPTTPTTAAAFDEGGNFIDVRFGPLTRGSILAAGNSCNGATLTAAGWCDFGSYNPTASAAGTSSADFGGGQITVADLLQWPSLRFDRNGVCRMNTSVLGTCGVTSSNFVRGALKQ